MLLPQLASATYTYFETDSLQNRNPQSFYINGQASSNSAGLTVSSVSGGAYIYKGLPPDGTNQYEVAATLNLPAQATGVGGAYVLFLEASPDASLGSTTTGSFYAFAIENPNFANGGCTATALLYKVINGSVLGSINTVVPCSNGAVYHAALGNDHHLRLWINGVEYMNYLDSSSPLTGTAGVGGFSMPSGNSISLVQIGPCDRIAPSTVDPASVQTFALANRVDLRAAGAADDSNGTGVGGYIWSRDGTQAATTQAPIVSDPSVTGGTSHSYSIQAFDHHGNIGNPTTFTVVVPANATLDDRQVGVRPTGSYWGGMGEQIDTRSGNLNFSLPLVTAESRGWSVPIGLAYNSQNWRLDAVGQAWQLGADVGYGFGWQLQIGSLTPIYGDYFGVQFYEYSDASGAVYHLYQGSNNGSPNGLWTSTESDYVTYDSNAQQLHFNDGSFWVFGCTSSGSEADAGTMYPTLIEDSNGNQVTVQYGAGKGATWVNSSARITNIQGVRLAVNAAGATTFTFTYNSDATPHLTNISNAINSQDSYTFTYTPNVNLQSPFGSTAKSFDQVSLLASSQNNTTNLTTSFTYDSASSGALAQVTFPLGGHIRWDYAPVQYAPTTVMEVYHRYLYWDPNVPERTYSFQLAMGSNNLLPASQTLTDSQAGAAKQWNFVQTQGPSYGLVSTFYEGTPGTAMRSTVSNWTQDSAGNSYIGRSQVISDPTQTYAVTKQVDQTIDAYGNVTQTKLYDYSNLNSPAKTYNTAYLTTANGTDYRSLYIRNRVLSVTVTDANNKTTALSSKVYDDYSNSPITATNGIQQQDTADYGTGFTSRGNVTGQATPSLVWHSHYDQTGVATWSGLDANPSGEYQSQVQSTLTNFAAPDQVTTGNSLVTNMSWSHSLQQMSQAGPNGYSTSTAYDSADRPHTVTSPYGAQTVYTYSISSPQITAVTNSHWMKTFLDGLGRTAQIQKGDSSATYSIQNFVYDSCGCNPMGKLMQQSMPYAPGQTPVATVYTFDSLGRMLTSTQPDGQSQTTYSYAGNAVTVTDPAGKWKTMYRDAYGQLIEVDEPGPNSEPTHQTFYNYDVFGHLIQASMPRTVGGQIRTQTRTWIYDPNTLLLTSKTSPEAGTVSYTYNADNTLATKTDANQRQTVYQYDTFGRVIYEAHGTGSYANGTFNEDKSQQMIYSYDGGNNAFCTAADGRLCSVTYHGPDGLTFADMYGYTAAGQVSGKRLQVNGINMDASYTYDSEGQVTSIAYPPSLINSDNSSANQQTYNYVYDSMERLQAMSDQAHTRWVGSAAYGPSDELLQMQAVGFIETRTYNANLQLTELVSGSNVHWKYNFSASTNNGQAVSAQDLVSGETIAYQYDSLKRLIQASASGDPSGSWSQTMTYDGFGNLTQKSASNAPALSVNVDPSTNRLLSNATYDNNGNLTAYAGDVYSYDGSDRLVQATPQGGATVQYGYDPNNHRIYKGAYNAGTNTYSAEEIYFYGAEGQKYGTWQIHSGSTAILQASVLKQWFGSRLITPEDRLGSRGKYYAFGEERTNISPANPPNDQEKFATYTRDSATGLDYADQRYYSSIIGRFTRPDPDEDSQDPSMPQSWNRYSYVSNDPANVTDPSGLCPPNDPACFSVTGFAQPPPSDGAPPDTWAWWMDGGWRTLTQLLSPGNTKNPAPPTTAPAKAPPSSPGNPPKNQIYPKLQKDQCQAIRTLLTREAQFGTMMAAFKSSNTFGDGTLAPLNSTFVPNIQTPIGQIDVDWFTDLQANGGRYNAFIAYPIAKLGWTAIRLATGQSIGNALPWSDPGERTAYGATLPWNSLAYTDIFTPQYMQQACPNF